MPKSISSFELTLGTRTPHQTLTNWLFAQLRVAVIEGRLRPGARLPASRDFASQYGLSRGTVVSVFERLQSEGYVSCRVGSGTRVNRVASAGPVRTTNSKPPIFIHRLTSDYMHPKPWTGLTAREGVRPFCMGVPALAEFPTELWGRIAGRRARALAR
jgi:GntR family transcriptional regulator/MocR family aminotransferase